MPVRLEADLDYELWEESLGREPTREEIALRNETIENNIAAFLASRTEIDEHERSGYWGWRDEDEFDGEHTDAYAIWVFD
ncbi:hypothetical protein MMC12_000294 [Toensbergia leucococca]|nr:hypothetical protein [Toensbergia leucococca]